MPYRPTQFHSTIIKPYYKDDSFKPIKDALEDALENTLKNTLKKNYNKYALKSDYNFNIIVVNIL